MTTTLVLPWTHHIVVAYHDRMKSPPHRPKTKQPTGVEIPLTHTYMVEITVDLNPAEYIPSTIHNRFQGHDVPGDVFNTLERNLVGSVVMTPSRMTDYGEVTGFRIFDKHHTLLGTVEPDGKWLDRKYGRT